jgi:class 3 adenylate cyclase/pimeloyl-ACP methyl ester carboxylesterase
MDAPQIQYVKTSDAVNIAYAVSGAGPPVVWLQPPFLNHLQIERQQPLIQAGFEAVERLATLIRLDSRGSGLSDRDSSDFSPIGYARDMEAVIDQLGFDSIAILAVDFAAAMAIAYTVGHPVKVSRLILMNPGWPGMPMTQRSEKILQMADDWELLTETMGSFAYGFEYKAPREYAVFMREATTHENFVRFFDNNVDLLPLAAQLRVPTLVIRHAGMGWLAMESTRSLVASIPGATMTSLPGTYIDTQAQTGRGIAEFLFGARQPAPQPRRRVSRDIQTILFTDLVAHTEMMSRLGDERGRDVLREHERITREVLKANGGTEVKTMGDGFMASFGSVTKAVECAVALQRAFAEREGEPLSVRVGLNAGEPIEEDGDLFGATVILASRIAAKADGGEILVADTVRGLCSGKGFLFADRGEFVAKGFEEPVRVSEVSWRE